MDHRREIDGLRALAVVPVILFHAGMETFSGGFVGVDVFFVISGYLITSIILAGQRKGTFTITNFYERRARRILPALFLVMFACLVPAWLLLIPQDLKLFAQSLAAVTVFGSNVLFYTANDYFDVASEFSPLLHTWSLAVEEQYYVLFPLFMLLAWRYARRWIAHFIAAGLLVSLAISEWGLNGHRAFTFYMLPTRGWELMIGALLVFAPPLPADDGRDWRREVGATLGLVMILAAIFLYDASTPFPGIAALLPTVGTALIIRYAVPGTFAAALLSLPLFVGIGLISYSAYLWHQPLLAFARHAFGGELEVPVAATAVALTFLFAWMSWRFVETPFRDKQRVSRKVLVASGSACAAFFIALGFVGHINNGFDNRLSVQQRNVAGWSKYDIDTIYRRHTCFLQATEQSAFADECRGGGNPDVFVWGDSYAAAIAAGLRETQRVAQYTGSGCPPMADYTLKRPPTCAQINRTASSLVRELRPRTVILHANWLRYPWLDAEKDLAATLEGLRKDLPETRVLLVGVVPQWSPTLPITLIRTDKLLEREHELPLQDMTRRRALDERLRATADAHGAQFVSALDAFCERERCRAVLRDGDTFAPIAWDNGHLTLPGSRWLAARLPLAKGTPE